jgi:hypothetical protein
MRATWIRRYRSLFVWAGVFATILAGAANWPKH